MDSGTALQRGGDSHTHFLSTATIAGGAIALIVGIFHVSGFAATSVNLHLIFGFSLAFLAYGFALKYASVAVAQRITPLFICSWIVVLPAVYNHGVIALFTPAGIIILTLFSIPKCWRLAVGYLLCCTTALAYLLSPVREYDALALRLLAIPFVLIHPLYILIDAEQTNREIRLRAIKSALYGASAIGLVFFAIRFPQADALPPLFAAIAVFGMGFYASKLNYRTGHSTRILGMATLLLIAALFLTNGPFPVVLTAGWLLLIHLLLRPLEALAAGLVLIATGAAVLAFEHTNVSTPSGFILRYVLVNILLLGIYQQIFTQKQQVKNHQPLVGLFTLICLLVTTFFAVANSVLIPVFEHNHEAVLERWLPLQFGLIVTISWIATIAVTQHRDLLYSQAELERKSERQRQLFAILGHELRTPAASLSMQIRQLQEEQPSELITQMEQTSEHLVNVLEDLRYVATPEEQKNLQYTTSPVVLHDFFDTILNSLVSLTSKAGLQVTYLADANSYRMLAVHTQPLRQITTNLVKNAALHSGAQNLRLTLEPLQAEHWQLRFHDDGKGIKATESLFEPFKRGDTKADGTGLGLHISRKLARAIGGDLRLCNELAAGTCFELSFPAIHSAEERPKAKPNNRFDGLRILFAEDNQTLQILTKTMLEKQGAEVFCATNGALALQMFNNAEHPFDLILTDIMMPEMDGYALTQALREAGYGGKIIGLSAATIGQETDQLIEAGADSCLGKPITMDKLQQALS